MKEHKLDYRPFERVEWFTLRRLCAFAIAVAIFAALFIFWKYAVVYPPAYRRWLVEQDAFDELGALAYQMIEQRAEGVVYIQDQLCISTFDSFAKYVKARRPELHVKPDAPNPFPNLLHGDVYDRLRSPATHPSDVLIAGSEVFYRGSTARRYRLTSEATLLEVDGSDVGSKVPWVERNGIRR